MKLYQYVIVMLVVWSVFITLYAYQTAQVTLMQYNHINDLYETTIALQRRVIVLERKGHIRDYLQRRQQTVNETFAQVIDVVIDKTERVD